MKKIIFISPAFAVALLLFSQPALSQTQGSVIISDSPNNTEGTIVNVSSGPDLKTTTQVRVSDQVNSGVQSGVAVTDGPRTLNSVFQEFRFSIPFAPDVQTITPEAPPPQTVINLITPETPICPVTVVQPEENPASAPVSITGTLASNGLTYDLTWSCTGYAGGCLITKNGQDYLKVDGDGILNGLPVEHFPAGTPAGETLVTIQIKSGSATDQWTYNGVIDAPTGPVVVPPPPTSGNNNSVPVKGNAYASILNIRNLWFQNQDALVPASLISDGLKIYDSADTIGASSFLPSSSSIYNLSIGNISYGSISDNEGIVRLRSSYQVQPGEYLWKEFKKYKLQYSYGAGWGEMVTNPAATTPTITQQSINNVYNTFRARAYSANCSSNPESEWFDVGNGSVQFYNNTNTPDRSIPTQTLYGPSGTPEAYAESAPFATHNKDEAPGSTLMLDFPLKVTSFLSSQTARDRVYSSNSYNPSGIPPWTQKISDAICIRLVEENGGHDSIQANEFPVIWKDSGTLYVNPSAPSAPLATQPTITITGMKPGDIIPANGVNFQTSQQHPGEVHTQVTGNVQALNFSVANLPGPASNYSVYGKVFNHPDTTPPPPHRSADIQATLLSPVPFQIFTAGAQNRIYWSGGAGTINLALYKGQAYDDPYSPSLGITAYSSSQVLGFISRNLSPNGEILWDAKTICDINGANCQPVSKYGTGPFFIGVYQTNIQNDSSVVIGTYSRYNRSNPDGLYSGAYNITILNVGPFFIEPTPNALPRFTDIVHGPTAIYSFAGAGTTGDFGTGQALFQWSPRPGDYALELDLLDNSTKQVLATRKVSGFDAGIPVISVTSPKAGDVIDINKPLKIVWSANKYVSPDSDIYFALNNYPDVDYVKGDERNRRYLNNPEPPYGGVQNLEPEQNWAQFSLRGIGKAKDGIATVDLRDPLITGTAYNTPIARILTPGWQNIELIPANQGRKVTSANVGFKDYIKLGGTMNVSYMTVTATNGRSGLYNYPALPNGTLDYSHPIAPADYITNAIDWTPAPFRIIGPVIEVPPPAAPGSAYIKVTYDNYNGSAATPEASSGVDSNGVYFHNFVYGAKVQYNQPYGGLASYNQPFTVQWAFPQKGSCTTIGDTDVYSQSGSIVWNNADKTQPDMSSNAGIAPQGGASILSNPKGGYRQKLHIGVQCTDGNTTEKAMLEVSVMPPANGIAANPVLLNATGMDKPTLTLNSVQGFSSASGFVIPVDNSPAPNDIPENNQFTVSWSVPSAYTASQLKVTCDMFGAPLALTDGRNWNQLTNMPTSGTVTLVAKDDQLPVVAYSGRKVRVFNLGLQCHSGATGYGGEVEVLRSSGLNMKIAAPAGSVSTGTYTPFIPGGPVSASTDASKNSFVASVLDAAGGWLARTFNLLFK